MRDINFIDTETNGLFAHLGHRPFLIGHCDYSSDVADLRIGVDDITTFSLMMLNPAHAACAHNMLFDYTMLATYSMAPAGELHDTAIAASIYNSLEPDKSLKGLALKYLKRENHEEQAIIEWFKKNGMKAKADRRYDLVPDELIRPYVRADVSMLRDLFKFYETRGVIDDPAYKREIACIPAIIKICSRGMRVDADYCAEQLKVASAEISRLVLEAREKFGLTDLGSDKQVAVYLYDELQLPVLKTTDSGAPSVDADTLELLEHESVEYILDYRAYVKMASTYLKPLIELRDAGGRIHSALNQTGARTRRMTSSNPNLQNIPARAPVINIRRAFTTAGPDWELLLIDLSQIELRVLAHYCQEPVMLETLKTRDGDLHAATARAVFGTSDPMYRTIAKTLNFAIIYGAGAAKLRATINRNVKGRVFSLEEVKDFRAKYKAAYPLLQEFVWKVENLVRDRAYKSPERVGWIQDMYGARYYCPADKAYRILNYLVQGCSANLFKEGMVRVHHLLADRRSCAINLVHDEHIIDIHKEEKHLIPEMLSLIEDHPQYRVPIFANAYLSTSNWAEKQPYCVSGSLGSC